MPEELLKLLEENPTVMFDLFYFPDSKTWTASLWETPFHLPSKISAKSWNETSPSLAITLAISQFKERKAHALASQIQQDMESASP